MTPADVLKAFQDMTGVSWKRVVPDVEAQAVEFVRCGFTLRDLELVILWTQRAIRNQTSRYSISSLQWKVLFGRHGSGDEFQTFQERLAMAETDVRRGWKPAYRVTGQQAAPSATKPAASLPEPASDDLRAKGKAALTDVLNLLGKKIA